MATIKQIAQDPGKALENLEKDLGAEPGTLLRELDTLTAEVGDWTQHLPYKLAVGYYEDTATRFQFQSHVDGCAYCQRLLSTLHPTDLDARAFSKTAVRAQPTQTRSSRSSWAGKLAVAAVVLITVSAIVVPAYVHKQDTVALVISEKPTLVHELRTQPTILAQLEKSDSPVERYKAARVYFAADKPGLAWEQVGEGLKLAGLTPVEAQKIINAADVPRNESAQALSLAAQRLHGLQSERDDPTVYLERAEVLAKLGFNNDALKSIQQYLKAANVDPKTLADFSETALAKSTK